MLWRTEQKQDTQEDKVTGEQSSETRRKLKQDDVWGFSTVAVLISHQNEEGRIVPSSQLRDCSRLRWAEGAGKFNFESGGEQMTRSWQVC